MFENYKVAVKVSLVDGVSGPMVLMAKHFARTNEEAKILQSRLTGIKNLFQGGTLLVGAGAAIAAPLLYAIDKAAELQKQMIGIQVATRGTSKEMDAMRGAIEKVASQTIFSNVDVAKMGKLIATGTGLGASEVSGLLPQYAKFADVQSLMKGTSYEQSVSDAIRLAHTAQKYDPQSLSKYLDTLTKASFIVPGGLGEVGHALKYSQGIAKTALGIDDDNMVLLVSLLNRLGFAGSRGGTNLIAAMTRTIPGIFGSGLLTGKSGESLKAMGMVDGSGHSNVFKDGKFDSFTWMGRLSEYVSREFARNPEDLARQHIMTNFQHAFGSHGSRVASLLSDPKALEQLRMIGQAFQGYGGAESVQEKFANESAAQQWMNAKTNFQSAMVELGMTLLPMTTRALQKLNGHLQKVIEWMGSHQDEVKHIAQGLLAFSAALVGLGIVATITAGVKGLALSLGLLGRSLTVMGGGTGLLGGGVGTGMVGGLAKLGLYAGGAWGAYQVGKLAMAGKEWWDASHHDGVKLTADAQARLDHPTVRTGGQSGGHINNTIVMPNGDVLARVVTKVQNSLLNMPPTGGRSFDPTMAPASILTGH